MAALSSPGQVTHLSLAACSREDVATYVAPRLRPELPAFADVLADAAQHPELEREAVEQYGLRATPFQVSDRHQSSLVNAWFHILVRYGGEAETLDFSDLIEVRTAANAPAEVRLRNPEYDLTRAIRDVLYSYRAGGRLFEGIDAPVELVGYVSDPALLPPLLLLTLLLASPIQTTSCVVPHRGRAGIARP